MFGDGRGVGNQAPDEPDNGVESDLSTLGTAVAAHVECAIFVRPKGAVSGHCATGLVELDVRRSS